MPLYGRKIYNFKLVNAENKLSRSVSSFASLLKIWLKEKHGYDYACRHSVMFVKKLFLMKWEYLKIVWGALVSISLIYVVSLLSIISVNLIIKETFLGPLLMCNFVILYYFGFQTIKIKLFYHNNNYIIQFSPKTNFLVILTELCSIDLWKCNFALTHTHSGLPASFITFSMGLEYHV